MFSVSLFVLVLSPCWSAVTREVLLFLSRVFVFFNFCSLSEVVFCLSHLLCSLHVALVFSLRSCTCFLLGCWFLSCLLFFLSDEYSLCPSDEFFSSYEGGFVVFLRVDLPS